MFSQYPPFSQNSSYYLLIAWYHPKLRESLALSSHYFTESLSWNLRTHYFFLKAHQVWFCDRTASQRSYVFPFQMIWWAYTCLFYIYDRGLLFCKLFHIIFHSFNLQFCIFDMFFEFGGVIIDRCHSLHAIIIDLSLNFPFDFVLDPLNSSFKLIIRNLIVDLVL